MKPKQCKARRLTERNLKALDNAVEKQVLALAYRFGETDEAIVRMTDQLLEDTRRWMSELREYMDERETVDGWDWEI